MQKCYSVDNTQLTSTDELALSQLVLTLTKNTNDTIQNTKMDFISLIKNIKSSPKYKLQTTNTNIAKEELNLVKSEYYPNINLSLNLESSTKFNDNIIYTSSVGDDSIITSNNIQSLASIYLNYNIFNFFSTTNKMQAAKYKINSLENKECSFYKDLALELLDYYYQALLTKERILYNKQILENSSNIYDNQKRLQLAGLISQIELTNQAIKIADLNAELFSLNKNISNLLTQINYIANLNLNSYNDILPFKDIQIYYNENIDSSFYNQSRAKELLFNIQTKQHELNAVSKEYFPSLNFYAKYDFYGYDNDFYNVAIKNTRRNGYRFGINISLNIFNGFSTKTKVQLAQLELLKAKMQFDDEKANFEKELLNVTNEIYKTQDELNHKLSSKEYANDNLISNKKLNKYHQIGANEVLSSKETMLIKKLIANENKIYLDMLKIKKYILMSDDICKL